ncbi:unnamed protein product, partial [Discosporangium mesarthrocarpum]
MLSTEKVTIETIISGLCMDVKGKPVGISQLGRSREPLWKAWGILNQWALEKLQHREAIDVPSFARVGWQRFRKLSGEMRIRPVFVLNHSFCRTHGLPFKRLLVQPTFTRPVEVINFTKLAIRYSQNLTKDMVYGALREIFRGIGDAISKGLHVGICFSFGVLEVHEGKVHFSFDPVSLAKD